MKEIGTCKECRWWENRPIDFVFAYCMKIKINTDPDFGCIHWEAKDG